MDERSQISREEARASLDLAAQSRQAASEIKERPVLLDAFFCVGLGIALAFAAFGGSIAMLTGLVIFVAVVVIHWLVARRWTRRRGRVFDERSVGSSMGKYLLLAIPLQILAVFVRPANGGQLWYSIVVGLAAAVLGFAFVRLDERYQARRLAAGDYGRHDLI